MQIEVRKLVRAFGNVRAVDNISFKFGSGNIFGFIGPNGAGKTTTIKIMSTLDMPDSGDVFFDGVSVVNDPEIVRRMIGYMPDSLPDYRDIQVWEYLDFFARSFGLKGSERTRTLAEVEEFANLGDIRYKYLAALSKGMKQRVSLARALVHNPGVLIMDEPAAGLDPRARLELRSLLKLLAGQGKAILLSSHILSELQDICDGAVIIERGKLLSAGTLSELLHDAEKSSAPGGTDNGGESGPLCALLIKCHGAAEAVRDRLLAYPEIKELSITPGGDVRLVIPDGDNKLIATLIGALFQADLPVSGFSRQEMGLEELFMKITEGKVQ